MKFRTKPEFDKDWHDLGHEHRALFKSRVAGFSLACDEFALDPARFKSWPRELRVKKRKGEPGIWEMTWSFSGPDGRATFEFELIDGEMRVVWRRIGSHEIYKNA